MQSASSAAIVCTNIRLLPPTCIIQARMLLLTHRDERTVSDPDLWLHRAQIVAVAVDADLGWIDIHRSHIMAAARWTKPAK